MTTHEIPRDEKGSSPEIQETEKIKRDHWSSAADMIDTIGDLVVAMRNDRMPDVSEYNFMFAEDKLSSMYRPKLIDDMIFVYGRLDEVMISTRFVEGDPSSSITIHYQFLKEDDNGLEELTLLTVDRPGIYLNSSVTPLDHIYENPYDDNGVEKPIRPIPSYELSRCVASLIYPTNMDGEWSTFDGMNLNDPTIYEPIINALQKHAKNFDGHEFFQLTPLDRSRAGKLDFTIDNGELVSAELQQVIESDIQMNGDDFVDTERIFSTEIDLSEGVSIDFLDIDQIGDQQKRQKVVRTELEHYDTMIEFAKHHIGQSASEEPARTTEIAIPYHQLTDEDLN